MEIIKIDTYELGLNTSTKFIDDKLNIGFILFFSIVSLNIFK